MRGADALIAALEAAGVDTVFGMPGGANLPLYDALLDSGLRHVLMRHEAGAGHAAEGYARATGRVGVAFATSGPGATNLVTPICDAQMDSIPTLFVTGQVRTALRGTNAFQEADVIGITAPIVKHSIAVERPGDVAQAIADALHLARAGRPGPVLVDVPVDVANGPARADTHQPQLPGYRPRTKPNGKQVLLAARALAAARRPVLYAGGGVVHAEAAAELAALARVTGAPVTTTLMALGAFPASDPQWIGMLGMHGRPAANWAMDEADLIVAVGARFDDRVTGDLGEFAPRAKVVHIDVDPSEIDKNVAAHIPIVGCAKRALAAIAAAYEGDPGRLDAWWERIRGWSADPAAAQRRRGGARRARRRQGRRDRHHRRRPAPDVGGQPPALRPPAPLDHLRRARHDGLRPAGRASARRSPGRTPPSCASPARARCCSTCRSWPPPRTRRSRSSSSCSTTRRSAWSASSRTCSGAAGAARSTSAPRPTGSPSRGRSASRPATRATTSRARSPRRSPSPVRRCCAWRSSATPTACRCSGPAVRPAK